MKVTLMIIGGVLVAFGLVDIIGSFTGFDLWGSFIGVQLPDILWKYSAYLELLAGYLVFQAGSNLGQSEQAPEA